MRASFRVLFIHVRDRPRVLSQGETESLRDLISQLHRVLFSLPFVPHPKCFRLAGRDKPEGRKLQAIPKKRLNGAVIHCMRNVRAEGGSNAAPFFDLPGFQGGSLAAARACRPFESRPTVRRLDARQSSPLWTRQCRWRAAPGPLASGLARPDTHAALAGVPFPPWQVEASA